MSDDLTENLVTRFEEALGYRFQNIETMTHAITHRSHADAQNTGSRKDYERLEFLGDAVLDLAVGDLLIHAYPQAREGDLSKMRASLVSEESLSSIARKFELGSVVRLGAQEVASGGAEKPSILADVIEALLGAIYQEGGYNSARTVVEKMFGDRIATVQPFDPKTHLQEMLQGIGSPPPQYVVESVEGPEHSPMYHSAVVIDGEVRGRGAGSSKKVSQQEAAKEAITLLSKAKEES